MRRARGTLLKYSDECSLWSSYCQSIAKALNPSISDVFELYCSFSERKERGSFNFSVSGSSSFESKLLDSVRDDMGCVPPLTMRNTQNYHWQVSQLLFVRWVIFKNVQFWNSSKRIGIRRTVFLLTQFLLFSLHLHHHRHISIVFPPPPHFYCFPSTTATTTTFLLFSLYHRYHHHISIVFPPPPPPPPPPHFPLFPSTTTTATFLLFSLQHHHHPHISIVFSPPPPPPPHFYCFLSTTKSLNNFLFLIWWWKENNRNVAAVVVVEGKQ